MTDAAILHLTSAMGGGIDRYIRDIAASVPRRHLIWHAGAAVDVVEDPHARTFTPLRDVERAAGARAAVDAWQRAQRVGLIHLHGADARTRNRFAMFDAAVPAIATLHDVGFLARDAFDAAAMPARNAAWTDAIAADFARVAAIVAPSAFILREAEPVFGRERLVHVAPGIARAAGPATPVATPAAFEARRPAHVVAIVGAVGPHKGSGLVDALARELAPAGVGIVVVGYTNEWISRGWTDGDRYFVHGPYVDAELPALLAAYRVEIALFPNRLPESWSYALSEVWAAGVPAIVPDSGALGERVARHGGGWRLPAGFVAADAAALVRRLLSAAGDEVARVKSQIDPNDGERIPTLVAMSRALDSLYERFAAPASAADAIDAHRALAPLLAANLDGFAFRAELVRFAEELDNARGAIDELRGALAQAQQRVRDVEANAAAWAAKLERDIDALKRQIGARDALLRGLPAPLRRWLLRRER